MHFKFRISKTIQAIGVVARAERSAELNYMRLLKVLYLADRESLRDTGRPITGDRVVAMKRGPVLSGVLDLIKGEHVELPTWTKFIRTNGYKIQILQDPDVNELSEYEIEKLQELAKKFEDLDEWDMVELSHRLPEWRDPGDTSVPIAVEDILRAVGRERDIPQILREAEEEAAFDRLFSRQLHFQKQPA